MLKKLILVAMFCCSFSSIASPQASTKSGPSAAPQIAANPSAFLKDFQTHWDTAKALALAVAEAMPAGDYSFKPTPEEMSFGQQIAISRRPTTATAPSLQTSNPLTPNLPPTPRS